MSKSLKTGDEVLVIAGANKGKTAKIVEIKNGKALLEGINERERHYKRSFFRPMGGKATIHAGIDPSNLKLVKAAEYKEEKKGKKEKGAK